MSSNLIALDQRVGTDITSASTLTDVMDLAGFNFDVEKVPVYTPEGEELDTHFLIRRSDTQKVFNVSRKRYTPVPIEDMFKPFHSMVQEHGATYEAAGTINDGAKCWVSATLPDSFKVGNRDDEIQKRIMMLATNDLSKRNAYFSIAHRVACNNQYHAISRAAGQSNYGVSHTKNWQDSLDSAFENFKSAILAHKDFEVQAGELNDKVITADEVRGFTTQLFPDRIAVKGEEPKRKSNRLRNRREEIVDLFITGAGNQGLTRWDAFNAVTEFLDHHNNVKKLEAPGTYAAERRLVSNVMGGAGDILKQKAMTLLLNVNKFEPALYDDE